MKYGHNKISFPSEIKKRVKILSKKLIEKQKFALKTFVEKICEENLNFLDDFKPTK
jgi:predicted DNA-binding protein